MWVFGIFLLLLGSSRATDDSNCLTEVLRCSRLRPAFNTHEDLLVSSQQMDTMCQQKDKFFECLDNVVASEVICGGSLPTYLEVTRALMKDLCSNISHWQQSYLKHASCINKQYTKFCTSPEFLVRIKEEPLSICSVREKAVNCIAVTLAMNCGMDAGKLFNHLLRMANDGDWNCYMVGSEILFLPAVQKVGVGFAQTREYDDELINFRNSNDTVEEQDVTINFISVGSQVFNEKEFILYSSEAAEFSQTEFNQTPISESSSKPFDTPYTVRFGFIDKIAPEKLVQYKKAAKLRPPETALRFHGNGAVSDYIKFPGFDHYEFNFCENKYENGRKMYVCIDVLREKDPICLEGGRVNNVTGIDPESIDPELGAKLYAMFPYSYYFRPYEVMQGEMYKNIHEINKKSFSRINELRSAISPGTNRDEPTTGYATESVHDFKTEPDKMYRKDSTSSHGSDSLKMPERLENHRLIRSYVLALSASRSKREAEEVAVSESVTLTSTVSDDPNAENLSREQEMLFDVLVQETSWIFENTYKETPVEINWITPTAVRLKYFGNEESRFLNMTCGRVNECHPNATGIHRCLYYFSVDEEEPSEEKLGTQHGHSESSTAKELNSYTGDVHPPFEERSGIMENVESLVLLDGSLNAQRMKLAVEAMSERKGLGVEKGVEMLVDPELETVENVPLNKPNALRNFHSDPSLQTKPADRNVDNAHTRQQFGDSKEKEMNAGSSSTFGRSARILKLLRSLNDLKKMLSETLNNIHVE